MPKRKKVVKTPLKAVLPKPKAELIELEDETPATAVPESKLMMISEKAKMEPPKEPTTPPQDTMLAILKEAPTLGWNFDVAYIDKEFRKGYIHLLRELVRLYNLPYNVNNLGVLLPK